MPKIKALLTLMVMGCVLVFSNFVLAADKATSKPSTSPAKVLTEFAASKGVKTCLKRMEQVNNYVVKNNGAGAYVFIPSRDVNKKIISTSLEIYPIGNTNSILTYASTSVVPTSANDCSIVYDTVSYRAQSCDKVKKGEFKNYKFSGVLAKNIQLLTRDEKQPNTRTFLMPAGNGCIVINKEDI